MGLLYCGDAKCPALLDCRTNEVNRRVAHGAQQSWQRQHVGTEREGEHVQDRLAPASSREGRPAQSLPVQCGSSPWLLHLCASLHGVNQATRGRRGVEGERGKEGREIEGSLSRERRREPGRRSGTVCLADHLNRRVWSSPPMCHVQVSHVSCLVVELATFATLPSFKEISALSSIAPTHPLVPCVLPIPPPLSSPV